MPMINSTTSDKGVATSNELPHRSGNGGIAPSPKRPSTQPNAKVGVTAWVSQFQTTVLRMSHAITGARPASDAVIEARVTDAEDFLAGLKRSGEIFRNSGGLFADMSSEKKKALVTLGLKRFTSNKQQRTDARRAIVAYADRYGYDAAIAFKDAFLKPCCHWNNGKKVMQPPFKLLRSASDGFGSGNSFKTYDPENLKRMGAVARLGGALNSAGRTEPTLENVAPHLSLDDLSALNDQQDLFSKAGGTDSIGNLLNVPARGSDGASGSEGRQKIRDVLLLATAKEAAAAKTEQRNMNLVSLNSLKANLLAAARQGPNELAKLHNDEMAKRTFQPDTGGANRQLREIGKKQEDVENYRANFSAAVSDWSKDNQPKFIGLSDLKEVSAKVIGEMAPAANELKFLAHKKEVENNEVSDFKDFSGPARDAYLENLESRVKKNASDKGELLDDLGFRSLTSQALHYISIQRNVLATQFQRKP